MKILVANIGSTSFKYRLFDMTDGRMLARGGMERIGCASVGGEVEIPDHGTAVERCLRELTDPEKGCLGSLSEVSAIGFKAVHGGHITGVQGVTEEVLAAMEEVVAIAPAHNPPYIAAMRQLRKRFPEIPLVAAFETGFHADIPEANRLYAVPQEWVEKYQIRRFGFHGASHRYISWRIAELCGRTDAGFRVTWGGAVRFVRFGTERASRRAWAEVLKVVCRKIIVWGISTRIYCRI